MKSAAPSLTPEQHAAIFTRDVSVALSAGAGCGKTFVLTERFLSHLDPTLSSAPPVELNELIAITFTERAAREMRDRIRQKCYDRLQSADAEHADYWLALLRSLDAARVSTIHAFCASLLRSHAVEAGLDPGFAVLDQVAADTVLTETIEDALRELLIARNETTLDLIVRFGLERLHDMLSKLLARGGDIDYDRWLQETPGSLLQRWREHHKTVYLPAVLRKFVESSAAKDALRVLREEEPSNPVMAARREVLLEKLPNLIESSDPLADLAAIRDAAMVKGGGGKSAWSTEVAYETFQAAATKLRKGADEARESFDFNADCALADARAGLELLSIANHISSIYDRKKREAAALDFGDLMYYARRMLGDPANKSLRASLASRVRLLLVDEFQDTDPGQVELVKALCGDNVADGKLFFVGDRKQSIYRFRGAQPEVFRRLKEEIPAKGRLPLKVNFRSQPAILDFVNALFAEEFAADDGDSVLLDARREQATQKPAIEFMWAQAEGGRTEKGASERARRREARWIARRLRAMLDNREMLVGEKSGHARAVRPGDIAILFRALSDVSYYEQALQEYKIDYYLVGGHAFYAQQEIYDLLNLLRSIDSVVDEVSLAGALRSPLFSLSDETLFWLAEEGESLSAGLFADQLSAPIDAEQARRVRFAAQTIAELRDAKDRLSIAELLNELLARTGYDAILLAEFLGERKLANVRKLIQQARSFDQSGLFSLSDFIVQLSQFVADQPHEPLAATHPEHTDIVKLMTIHQSKGLEFPVVVVPDLDRSGHRIYSSVEFTPELGPLLKVPSPPGQESSGCTGYDLHSLIASEEEHAEMSRLFYVATTRAADHLILSSSVFNLEAPVGPWMKLLAGRFDLQSGKFTGELPPRVTMPEVRVTLEEPETTVKPTGRAARVDLRKLVRQATQALEQGGGSAPPLVAPVPVDPSARKQFSFSRLSGHLHADRERPALTLDDDVPSDDLSTVDPLGFGTLVHAVLSHPCFAASETGSMVRRYAEVHLPDASEEELAEVESVIQRYCKSSRAKEVEQAADVHREIEFLLAWPPDGDRSNVFLCGFIDCLYQDSAGAWHLLDFKTNQNVTTKNVAQAAEQYELQMHVYALAAEKVLKVPPATLTLYFLRSGIEHAFPWNDEARARTTELVSRAIASAIASGAATDAALATTVDLGAPAQPKRPKPKKPAKKSRGPIQGQLW